jgi:phage terminase small subunit
MAEKQLTPKQARYVEEILIDENQTQAAIRAGYSERNAVKIGSQLMDKPHVAKAIQAARDKRSKRTEITSDRVLQELGVVAFANLADYVIIEDGVPRVDLERITREQFAAVSEITQDFYQEPDGKKGFIQGRRTKLKFHSKMDALTQLAKHLGINPDTLNVKAEGRFEIIIQRGAGK